MATARSIVDEMGFAPCRDEKCDDDSIHPAHDLDLKRNRLRCPLCADVLIRLPRERMRCANCQWRGCKTEALLSNKGTNA